jgi:hypothetical protein
MTITVYVGDGSESLSLEAKKHDKNAYHVHKKNYKEFLSHSDENDITVYTALADLPKITESDCALSSILRKASNVVYAPPSKWINDHSEFNVSSERHLTEYIIMLIKSECNDVSGLDLEKYNKRYIGLKDERNTESKTLWVAGCSISHGVGVKNHERYGAIVSDKLQIPLVSLTEGASSIEWASDQILRSDIRKGDIVIWGLTSEYRSTLWSMEKNRSIPDAYGKNTVDDTKLYKGVILVHQVINFCNKVGANLIIMPLICSEELKMHFSNINEFLQFPLPNAMLDIGSDGMHPGKKQHNAWADICVDIIGMRES